MNVFVVGDKKEGAWIKDVKFTNFDDSELVLLTGGEDVNPAFYGESMGLRTCCNIFRDEREKEIFDKAVASGKFIAGICRGFQFIHAVQGYQVAQHITTHENGSHEIIMPSLVGYKNVLSFESFIAPGSHHQNPVYKDEYNMLPLAFARPNGKERCFNGDGDLIDMNVIEAAIYPTVKAMGMQYHPEWTNDSVVHKMSNLFLENLFNVCSST